VVSIIALLIAILLPAVASARRSASVTQCLSNQRQIGVALNSHAVEHKERLPVGPASVSKAATNQLFIAPGSATAPPEDHSQYTGVGVLLDGDYLQDNRAMLCPDASNTALTNQNLGNLSALSQDAYANYTYRQLDQTTNDRIDNLGNNELGQDARALLLDLNQFIPAGLFGPDPVSNVNHGGEAVNILYLDGHAASTKNPDHLFDARESDYLSGLSSLLRRAQQIIVTADYAETNDPTDTPALP
jgi:prepilin-type processing-associated H-X9-DG protein